MPYNVKKPFLCEFQINNNDVFEMTVHIYNGHIQTSCFKLALTCVYCFHQRNFWRMSHLHKTAIKGMMMVLNDGIIELVSEISKRLWVHKIKICKLENWICKVSTLRRPLWKRGHFTLFLGIVKNVYNEHKYKSQQLLKN